MDSSLKNTIGFLLIIIVALFVFTQLQSETFISGQAIAALDDKLAAEKISASAKTIASGKVTENIGIGGGIVDNTQPKDTFDNPVESDDLGALQEGKILFNGGNGYSDISVHDEIWFGANSPSLESSLSKTSVDSDYTSDVALEVDEGAIYYYYVFGDAIDLTQIDEDHPVDITFLGKEMRITGAEAGKISVKTGETLYLTVGEEVQVGGHTLKLDDVADGKVAVSLDGGSAKTIDENDVYSWSDFEVSVDSVFYKSGDPASSSATLVVGVGAATSYSDGDDYVGELESNPYWEWVIDNLDAGTTTSVSAAGTATGPILAIKNSFSADDASGTDPAPVKNTGCYPITTTNPYLQLCIDEIKNNGYVDVEIKLSNANLAEAGGVADHNFVGLNTVPVIEIKANKGDGLKLNRGQISGTDGYLVTDAETDTIYLMLNNTDGGAPLVEVFYVDDQNDVVIAGNLTNAGTLDREFASIEYQDTKGNDIRLRLQGLDAANRFYLNITAADNEIVGATDRIGVYFDQASATEFGGCANIMYVSDLMDVSIAAQDDSLRTKYGIIIKNPDSSCTGDNLEFSVPGDAVRAKVSLKTYEATGSNVVTANKAQLVGEVNLADIPSGTVLVGGPAINEYTAKAMGKKFPTYGDQLGWTPGWCYIKSHRLNGKQVTVVAGYEKEDTLRCAGLYVAGTKSYNGV